MISYQIRTHSPLHTVFPPSIFPLLSLPQLQEAFSWAAFKKVFAAYHDMSDVPGDNKGKMNLYTKTFSMAVEHNLCAFFKAWGWPIEAATEKELSKLPPWTNHPMARYQ